MREANAAPICCAHDGIVVVRDDLFPGGTKARFLPVLFDRADEVVYASPRQGGAQTALAHTAARLGKRATIFVAHSKVPHNRALEAKRVGATVVQVPHGYLSNVQAKARTYCDRTGALLAPFGVNLPEAVALIASDARRCGVVPDVVWCASGSGVLTRALQAAWPHAAHHVVQVGRTLHPGDVGAASVHVAPLRFEQACKSPCPFPSDPHYDRKAWQFCREAAPRGTVLFWNVTGPATP